MPSRLSQHPRIEWLRTESNGLIHPPHVASSAPAIARETSETSLDFIDLNDIPEDPPEAQSCANCVAPRPATVQLRACGHWLCESCCAFTWQVYSVQLPKQPRCPLPNCQTMSTQLGQEGAMEPWLKVSQHILSSRFQDIPVLVPPSSQSTYCRCFKCDHAFCQVCRSPPHPGQSCFDCERRTVRMAKRRPPLPMELAELAAKKAEEIRERDKREAELAFAFSKDSSSFQDLIDHFDRTFGASVTEGLNVVLDYVDLKAVNLARRVQDRFLQQISRTGIGQMRPAFHGTNAANYESIFERGLLIPGFGEGSDVRMAHGDAHGRGIYTANVDAAWLSKGFCSEASMLVCAVLDCDNQVRHVGDAMVVKDPTLVIPLFLAVGTWAGARPPLAQLPVPAPVMPNPSLKPQPRPQNSSKGEKASKTDPKPKAKQSKFMARLAARSKRH